MLLGRLDQVHETLQRVAAMLAGVGAGGPPGGGPPGGGPPGGGPPGGGPPGRGGPPGNMFGGEPLDEEHALSPSVGGDAPSRRLDRYYVDTASFHPVAIQAGIATVGVDRVVVGTDHPPAADSPQPALDALAAVELSVEDREKILFRNARALLER